MISIILSVGAINALIPVIVIVVLIAAAAGLTRGWQIFALFGISSFMGITSGTRGTLGGKSGFKTGAFSGAKGAVQSVTKLAKTATVGEKFGSYDAKKAKDERDKAEQAAKTAGKSWAETKLAGAKAAMGAGYKSGMEVKGGLGAISGHVKEGRAARLEESMIGGRNVLGTPSSIGPRIQKELKNVTEEISLARTSGADRHTMNTLEVKRQRIERIMASKTKEEYMRRYKMYYRKNPINNPSAREAAKNMMASKELHILSVPGAAIVGTARSVRDLAMRKQIDQKKNFREMYDILSRTQGTVAAYSGKPPRALKKTPAKEVV